MRVRPGAGRLLVRGVGARIGALPEAASSIRLRLDGPRQRVLAARLCQQDAVRILLVDRAGRWLAQVDLALGEDTRELIAAALRAGPPDPVARVSPAHVRFVDFFTPEVLRATAARMSAVNAFASISSPS